MAVKCWLKLKSDPDAKYEKTLFIDASKIAFTQSVKLALSNCSAAHLEAQKSFVVVVGSILSLSNLEELFVVVPTISEAIDYIYMEELEKNL